MDEITLSDIVNIVQHAWKKLIVSAFVGAILGLGGWYVLVGPSVEYILLNNNGNDNYALDLVSWKMLQKSLPNLAGQIIEENKVPDNQTALYKEMATDEWWHKNIVPSYALSRTDARDLAVISKGLDIASTTILNFTLTASGSSKQQAIEKVLAASKFFRNGGAYLQLHSLLREYEIQTINIGADLEKKISNTRAEMRYQQNRIRQLEDLRKRFPSGNLLAQQQLVDVNVSSAKYLPLQIQIIAANNDLNSYEETLIRLQNRLDQLGLVKTFLEQALPLQSQVLDGLKLNQLLLDIEVNLRAKLAKDDSNAIDFLDSLKAQLLNIQVRFTRGLEANTMPISSGKKDMIKAAAGGLVAAFFLMLMFLLGQKVWENMKEQDAKTPS